MGVVIKWKDNGDLVIKPPAKLAIESMDTAAAQRTRSVLMFLAPLIHEKEDFTIPFPGGCKLGSRSVKPHLFALEEFGANFSVEGERYRVKTAHKQPDKVVLYEMGDTVTENAIMAAARTPGVTNIKKASANYMVQELCYFLQELGVKFEGIGTSHLKITGVRNIKKNL